MQWIRRVTSLSSSCYVIFSCNVLYLSAGDVWDQSALTHADCGTQGSRVGDSPTTHSVSVHVRAAGHTESGAQRPQVQQTL